MPCSLLRVKLVSTLLVDKGNKGQDKSNQCLDFVGFDGIQVQTVRVQTKDDSCDRKSGQQFNIAEPGIVQAVQGTGNRRDEGILGKQIGCHIIGKLLYKRKRMNRFLYG